MWLYSLVILWILKILSLLCAFGIWSLVLWDSRTLYEGDTCLKLICFLPLFLHLNSSRRFCTWVWFCNTKCSYNLCAYFHVCDFVSLDSVGHWSSCSRQKLCHKPSAYIANQKLWSFSAREYKDTKQTVESSRTKSISKVPCNLEVNQKRLNLSQHWTKPKKQQR
jgi:hypothetical protein